jgi:hypothetical protein
MKMSPRIRRLALTAHITVSVGWLGAVLAYLALAVSGLESADAETARAVYIAMELVARIAIVPLAFATIATGLLQALGTEWGLFSHYWVLAKFLLTLFATAILLGHMKAIHRMAELAATTPLTSASEPELRWMLVVHPAGGLVVLFAATVLSVHKPWGKIQRRAVSGSSEP